MADNPAGFNYSAPSNQVGQGFFGPFNIQQYNAQQQQAFALQQAQQQQQLGLGTLAAQLSGQKGLAEQQYGQQRGLAEQQQGYGLQTLAAQLSGQKSLAQQSQEAAAALQEKSLAEQQKEALIGQQTAEYAPGLQQQRFNTVFPYLQGILGGLPSFSGSGGKTTASGSTNPGGTNAATGAGTGGYAVSAGIPGMGGNGMGEGSGSGQGVINPRMLQAQINQARALGEQGTATRIRDMQSGLAARGFGPASALGQALAAQYEGQNLQTQAEAEQQARLGAAQTNAQFGIQQGQLAEQSRSNLANESIARMAPYFSTQNALIAALAGLV